eukprot:TRINITY_DN4813_c0_g1_i1.p1 TRINITY_DN4813_c0_g1~~TRINITY_DN4813_c0_g1_i1.p1  ORF type:complete len:208 (+),score=45.74 TRINITY_DN4813_c0_g1_i1:81-704(+)
MGAHNCACDCQKAPRSDFESTSLGETSSDMSAEQRLYGSDLAVTERTADAAWPAPMEKGKEIDHSMQEEEEPTPRSTPALKDPSRDPAACGGCKEDDAGKEGDACAIGGTDAGTGASGEEAARTGLALFNGVWSHSEDGSVIGTIAGGRLRWKYPNDDEPAEVPLHLGDSGQLLLESHCGAKTRVAWLGGKDNTVLRFEDGDYWERN